jgi:hypothetical protein
LSAHLHFEQLGPTGFSARVRRPGRRWHDGPACHSLTIVRKPVLFSMPCGPGKSAIKPQQPCRAWWVRWCRWGWTRGQILPHLASIRCAANPSRLLFHLHDSHRPIASCARERHGEHEERLVIGDSWPWGSSGRDCGLEEDLRARRVHTRGNFGLITYGGRWIAHR